MITYIAPSGSTFTFQKTEPYTRRDKSVTSLDTWQAPCAHPGCFDFAVVRVPVGADPASCKAFGKVHCQSHVLTKTQVKERWLAACTEANTKITPEILQQLIAHRRAGVPCSTLALTYDFSESRIRAITSKHVKNRTYTRKV